VLNPTASQSATSCAQLARENDLAFEQTVEVPATGLKTVVFNQWTKKEVAKETPGPTY